MKPGNSDKRFKSWAEFAYVGRESKKDPTIQHKCNGKCHYAEESLWCPKSCAYSNIVDVNDNNTWSIHFFPCTDVDVNDQLFVCSQMTALKPITSPSALLSLCYELCCLNGLPPLEELWVGSAERDLIAAKWIYALIRRRLQTQQSNNSCQSRRDRRRERRERWAQRCKNGVRKEKFENQR